MRVISLSPVTELKTGGLCKPWLVGKGEAGMAGETGTGKGGKGGGRGGGAGRIEGGREQGG